MAFDFSKGTLVEETTENSAGGFDFESGTLVEEEAPPESENGFFEMGGKIASAVKSTFGPESALGQFGVGFGKGVLSTIATVPKKVTEIAEILGKKAIIDETGKGVISLAQQQTQFEEVLNSLPADDPKREQVIQAMKENMEDMLFLTQKLPKNLTEEAERIFDPLKPEGTAQKVGFTTEKIAEFMVPAGKIKEAETAIKTFNASRKFSPVAQKLLNTLERSGVEAISAGTVSAAQGREMKDVKNATILSFLFSIPFKAAQELREPVGKVLEERARSQFSKILKPTTKENKRLAEKTVPELLKRRVIVVSRKGLEKKAVEELAGVGDDLESAYNSLPPNTKVQVAPIISKIEEYKSKFLAQNAAGEWIVVDRAGYKAAVEIQQTFLRLAKNPAGFTDDIAIESIRRARQILDKAVGRKGGFAISEFEGSLRDAQLEGANAIREQLAKQFPNIDKINKEYTFWSNVRRVIEATNKRITGQEPLSETLFELGGGVVGASRGGLKSTVIGLVTGKLLIEAIRSPLWRSTSAVTKHVIAESLLRGDSVAVDILNRIVTGAISRKRAE